MSKSTQVSPSLTKGNSIEGTDFSNSLVPSGFWSADPGPESKNFEKSKKATPKTMGSVIQRNRRSCETAYSPMIRRKDLPKLSADLGKDKKIR